MEGHSGGSGPPRERHLQLRVDATAKLTPLIVGGSIDELLVKGCTYWIRCSQCVVHKPTILAVRRSEFQRFLTARFVSVKLY